MTITPKDAEKILERSRYAQRTTFRPPRLETVARYAKAMREGRWKEEPTMLALTFIKTPWWIRFTPLAWLSGLQVIDGRMRLMAVIESGVAVKFNIELDDLRQS
jgi:hypothetical protein